MDRYRFYCPNLSAGRGTLPEDQAHHARSVLRLAAGDEVEVFDGRGGAARGKIETIDKKQVTVMVGSVEQSSVSGLQLTLATATPKADRAEWLVEQASQLNAAAVRWLDCERSVVKPREGSAKIEKFRRLAIESAKQCGRNVLLRVEGPSGLEETLAWAKEYEQKILWLEPRSGRELFSVLAEMRTGSASRVCALIGPEGGWSPREIGILEAQAGIVRVRLTPTILRIETACATVAAACALVS